jgi:tripartite-type tricarboxylate transporter receptor subunit TctC
MMTKILLGLSAMITATAVHAWQPTRPVTVLVPSAPGAFIENSFRMVSKIVEEQNPGVSFVIVNKPGADGVIATNQLAEAAPDGLTIATASQMSTFVTQDIFQKDIKKYNSDTFVVPVLPTRSPLAIVAKADSAVNTPREFLDKVKNSTQPLNIAIGGGPHKLTYEYILDRFSNSNVQSIAFQGPLQAVTGVASDSNIEFGIMPLQVAWPMVQAGKVKVIAITADRPLSTHPTIPLIRNSVPGLEVSAGSALLLPPGTPREVADWYNRVWGRAMQTAEAQKLYADNFLYFNSTDLQQQGVRAWINNTRQFWKSYIDGPARKY